MFLTAPVRITSGDDCTRLHLVKTQLRGKDKSGRPRVFPVNGSNFYMDVDTVIHAVGQMPEISPDFGLESRKPVGSIWPVVSLYICSRRLRSRRRPWRPRKYRRSNRHGNKSCGRYRPVFGRKRLNRSDGNPIGHIPPALDLDENFLHRRFEADFLPLEKWLAGFETVELGLSEEKAVREANRCLRCSLRVGLSQMEFAKTAQFKE